MILRSSHGELLKSVGTYTRQEQRAPLLQTPLIGPFLECDPCKPVPLSLHHWLAPIDSGLLCLMGHFTAAFITSTVVQDPDV